MTIEYKLDISVWICSNLAYLTGVIIRFFSILCTLISFDFQVCRFMKHGKHVILRSKLSTPIF